MQLLRESIQLCRKWNKDRRSNLAGITNLAKQALVIQTVVQLRARKETNYNGFIPRESYYWTGKVVFVFSFRNSSG
jgi:hypothetical protein